MEYFRSKNDSVTEFGDNLEDGSIELAEKNSSESSPSPSDSSNNVDDTTYTVADLGYYLILILNYLKMQKVLSKKAKNMDLKICEVTSNNFSTQKKSFFIV
ncbi:unnamed protein product [Wuchereria bancrofti]|uniref:Uncharacterized protein n=1 Tax=Wuchereria bancrofti TaxID=6293 RepID=A0A3P7E5G7_WUCBA|nr:unnamed protein product [Wuchereria bancrofti]